MQLRIVDNEIHFDGFIVAVLNETVLPTVLQRAKNCIRSVDYTRARTLDEFDARGIG